MGGGAWNLYPGREFMIDLEILSNQQIKEIYYDVYNGFWKKYRDHVPEWKSEEWNRIVEHEKQLRRKHKNCPLILHMIQDLMDQLEARSRRRGYEPSREKASEETAGSQRD